MEDHKRIPVLKDRTPHIPLGEIKTIYAPILTGDEIIWALNWASHPTKVHEPVAGFSYPVFIHDGIMESLNRFFSTCRPWRSSPGDSIVLTHEALFGRTIRIPLDRAIDYFELTEKDLLLIPIMTNELDEALAEESSEDED